MDEGSNLPYSAISISVKHSSLRVLILFSAIFFMVDASFSVLVLPPLAQAQNLPKDSRSTPDTSVNTPSAVPTADVFEEYSKAVQASSDALTKYGDAVKASAAAIVASNNALKPPAPESVRDYGWKRAEDFFWSLTTWIFLVALVVAVANWARIKVEVERLARSLQTVRLGPVELALRGID
jgi:hypothetical protein